MITFFRSKLFTDMILFYRKKEKEHENVILLEIEHVPFCCEHPAEIARIIILYILSRQNCKYLQKKKKKTTENSARFTQLTAIK